MEYRGHYGRNEYGGYYPQDPWCPRDHGYGGRHGSRPQHDEGFGYEDPRDRDPFGDRNQRRHPHEHSENNFEDDYSDEDDESSEGSDEEDYREEDDESDFGRRRRRGGQRDHGPGHHEGGHPFGGHRRSRSLDSHGRPWYDEEEDSEPSFGGGYESDSTVDPRDRCGGRRGGHGMRGSYDDRRGGGHGMGGPYGGRRGGGQHHGGGQRHGSGQHHGGGYGGGRTYGSESEESW